MKPHLRGMREAAVTCGIALAPVAATLVGVTVTQKTPLAQRIQRQTADVRPDLGVLVLIGGGDPSWPKEPLAQADATSEPSPVTYNTEIIARNIGDELSVRGVSVTVESLETPLSPDLLRRHAAVVVATPVRRWTPGPGLVRLVDEGLEGLEADEIARLSFGIVLITAENAWADETARWFDAVLARNGAKPAKRGVFPTSLLGEQVLERQAEFAASFLAEVDKGGSP